MSTYDLFKPEADSAYRVSNKYADTQREHLSALWRYLASYYTALAFDHDTVEYDQYGDLETLVKRIDRLVDSSLPSNISKCSAGGFGYHGDTPIGENWAIVYTYAPNVASLLEESNWESFLSELESFDDSDYTVERFSSWLTPTENLMVRMIDENGKPTAIAIKVIELLQRLENYPVLNEDHYSELEFNAEHDEQMSVIADVIRDNWLIADSDLSVVWKVTTQAPDTIETLVWKWINENDQQALERASYGYSDSGGYGLDETAVLGALYALGALDKSAYDAEEWQELEESIEDRAWRDIQSAFRGWHIKL